MTAHTTRQRRNLTKQPPLVSARVESEVGNFDCRTNPIGAGILGLRWTQSWPGLFDIPRRTWWNTRAIAGRIADLWGFNCRSLPHLDSLRYRAKRRDFVGIRVR